VSGRLASASASSPTILVQTTQIATQGSSAALAMPLVFPLANLSLMMASSALRTMNARIIWVASSLSDRPSGIARGTIPLKMPAYSLGTAQSMTVNEVTQTG
jgi:hypothetical protein